MDRSSRRLFRSGDNSASQVPGEPQCAHALFSDPARIFTLLRLFCVSMLPSSALKPWAPRIRAFRGSIARPTRSLSTLHDLSHPKAAQDSVPAVANFAGWDWVPTGFQRKVSNMSLYMISPFPRLSLAHQRRALHLQPKVFHNALASNWRARRRPGLRRRRRRRPMDIATSSHGPRRRGNEVGRGAYAPPPLTDPDVRISRIRFLGPRSATL